MIPSVLPTSSTQPIAPAAAPTPKGDGWSSFAEFLSSSNATTKAATAQQTTAAARAAPQAQPRKQAEPKREEPKDCKHEEPPKDAEAAEAPADSASQPPVHAEPAPISRET